MAVFQIPLERSCSDCAGRWAPGWRFFVVVAGVPTPVAVPVFDEADGVGAGWQGAEGALEGRIALNGEGGDQFVAFAQQFDIIAAVGREAVELRGEVAVAFQQVYLNGLEEGVVLLVSTGSSGRRASIPVRRHAFLPGWAMISRRCPLVSRL